MELEDLKQVWSQYDKKLEDNLKLNELLLKKLNFDKTRKALNLPYAYDISGIIIIISLDLFMLAQIIRFINEPKYSVPAALSILVGIIYFIFGIKRIKSFSSFDYLNDSVVHMQKKLMELKSVILRYRRLEIILMPLLVISILPPLVKALHNIDIYEKISFFLIEVVFIVSAAIPVTIWINRNLCDKKLKAAETYLKEIKEFEKE